MRLAVWREDRLVVGRGLPVTFFASPPVTGTSHTSLFVVHASLSLPSRFDTNASSLLSGENAIALSSCWPGGESKSPGVTSRAGPPATAR